MEFQGGGRKNARKILVGVENFDGIPGGTVSENGYPRQGVRTITGKAHYLISCVTLYIIHLFTERTIIILHQKCQKN